MSRPGAATSQIAQVRRGGCIQASRDVLRSNYGRENRLRCAIASMDRQRVRDLQSFTVRQAARRNATRRVAALLSVCVCSLIFSGLGWSPAGAKFVPRVSIEKQPPRSPRPWRIKSKSRGRKSEQKRSNPGNEIASKNLALTVLRFSRGAGFWGC